MSYPFHPRERDIIENDMECLKRNFDRRYFGHGQPYTDDYRYSLATEWERLNSSLKPLVDELRELDRWLMELGKTA